MDLHELTQHLPGIGPVFGVLGTVAALAGWLVRMYIGHLKEQLKQLEQDKLTLAAKITKAEAECKLSQYERDNAIQKKKETEEAATRFMKENIEINSKEKDLSDKISEIRAESERNKTAAIKYKAEAENYLKAAHEQRSKRKDAEARLEKVEATLAAVTSDAKTESESAEKRLEAAELSATTALKFRNEAEAKAAAYLKERDALRADVERLEKQIEGVTKQDGRVWNVPVGSNVVPFVPLTERRTPVISILNLKGGVGKTTITANLGGYLGVNLEKRVLLIDLDHQRSLTQLLLTADNRKAAAIARRTVQDFLLNGKRTGTDLHAAAEKVPHLDCCSLVTNSDAEAGYGEGKNLDDVEMSLLGHWLVNPRGDDVRFLMRSALQSQTINEAFDFVLIDCPPRLTTACINALTASDFVLIPTQAEAISIRSVPHLLRRLKVLRTAGVLSHLQVLGLIANMVSSAAMEKNSAEAKLLREFEALAEDTWGEPVKAFKSKLKDSGYYASASKKLEDNHRLSLAVSNNAIREQYEPLFKEIERRIYESIGLAGVPS